MASPTSSQAFPFRLPPSARSRFATGWRAGLALAIGLLTAVAGPAHAETAAPTPSATSLDAELRFRASNSYRLGHLQAGQDEVRTGFFHRMRLGSGFERAEIGAYLQLQAAGALGDSGPALQPLPVGLQQGRVRLKVPGVTGVTVEAGRMVLDFGLGRQIGRYDFHDTGHAFDGLALHLQLDQVLQVHPLAVKIRRNTAQPDQERNLAGIYAHGYPAAGLRGDLYLLYLGDDAEKESAHLQTMGLRIDWRFLSLMALEAEGALQVGDVRAQVQATPLDHFAWMVAGSLAAEIQGNLPASFALHGQAYSGDDVPSDTVSTAWRPLYPSLDEVVGLLQLFRPSNLLQYGARIKVGPWQGLSAAVDGRVSAAKSGALMPGFSGKTMACAGGSATGEWCGLGAELDVRLGYDWRPWAGVLLAGGVFLPASDLAAQVGGDVAGQVLLQWTSRF